MIGNNESLDGSLIKNYDYQKQNGNANSVSNQYIDGISAVFDYDIRLVATVIRV